jgi:cytochrome P450
MASSTISANPVSPVLAGPVPPAQPLPYLQYLRTVRRNFIDALDESMYRAPIVRQGTAITRSFIVNHPDGLRRVLLENAANYPRAAVERRILGPAMGNGLILSEGETWRAHRHIMAPAFDHRTVERYAPVMVDAARKQADRWSSLPAGASVEMEEAMMELTLEIISRSMFAADSDAIKSIIREGSARYQHVMWVGLLEFVPAVGPLWSAWKGMRGRRIMRDFNRVMYGLIAVRKNNPPKPIDRDLLDLLIAARDEQGGAGMTARQIRDQVLTIFVAGHETTALSLMWTWYLLALHPEHEARMHAELDSVLGGREPVWSDVAKLSVTRAIVQESMRLYPAVHTLAFREAREDDTVCGMRIPGGSMVTIMPWIIHRQRTFWKNPDCFDPGRFSPEASAGRDRLAYLPFGFGPRTCIGAAFAMTEAVLIVATLAQRFRPRIAPEARIELQAGFTLHAKYGMPMQIAPR